MAVSPWNDWNGVGVGVGLWVGVEVGVGVGVGLGVGVGVGVGVAQPFAGAMLALLVNSTVDPTRIFNVTVPVAGAAPLADQIWPKLVL